MAQWLVKDLSNLTNVSVQTLHHYDRINLLKPSVRLPNGYRLYSEKDLLKLQQIIALKFFNFSLSQIKSLLSKPMEVAEHFTVQAALLEKKAKKLLEASQNLKKIAVNCKRNKSIPWETIIKVIEVYYLTQTLESGWAGKILTPEELKEYVGFEQQAKTKYSAKEQKAFKKDWDNLVKEVNSNLINPPNSVIGIALGERCLEWVNSFYGKEFASLRTTIWVKGIREGHLNTETGLTGEAAEWLDKAIDAYVENRSIEILGLLKSHPYTAVLKRWEEMLNDYFGDNNIKKKEFCLRIIDTVKLSKASMNWLKSIVKNYS